MAIYLKIVGGAVEAYGDMETLKSATGSGEFGKVVSDEQWAKANCSAHVSAGEIVLGLSEEDGARWVRAARDRKLRTEIDSLSAMRLASMDEEERTEWAQYRQALLDVPQQEGFPWDGVNVPWPEKPE